MNHQTINIVRESDGYRVVWPDSLGRSNDVLEYVAEVRCIEGAQLPKEGK
jgi:hypothetical protein